MSIFEPVPKPELRPPLTRLQQLGNFKDIWDLFQWALWNPRRARDYLDFIEEHFKDDHEDNRSAQSQEEWNFVLNSFLMTNAIAISVCISTCIFVWSYTPLEHPQQTLQFLGWSAFSVGPVVVAGIAIAVVLGVYKQLAAMPSLCLAGSVLMAVATPVFMLHRALHLSWPNAQGLLIISVLSIALGVSLNLWLVLFDDKIAKLRSDIPHVEWIFGGYAAVAGLAFAFIVGVEPFEATLPRDTAIRLAYSLAIPAFLTPLSMYRPLNWIYGLFMTERAADDSVWHVPYVTPISVPAIRSQLRQWLDIDWTDGLRTADFLWETTLQQRLIHREICYALEHAKVDDMVERVIGLTSEKCVSKHGHDWRIDDFLSREQRKAQENARQQALIRSMRTWHPLGQSTTLSPRETRHARRNKLRELKPASSELAVGSDLQIAIAGCWYLQNRHPGLASAAFGKLSTSATAREFSDIAKAFDLLWNEDRIADKDNLPLPAPPQKPKRSLTWSSIRQLQDVLHQIWIHRHVQIEPDHETNLQVLKLRLDAICDNAGVPNPENEVFTGIVSEWKEDIASMISAQPLPRKLKAFDNPYIYLVPVKPPDLMSSRGKILGELRSIIAQEHARPLIIQGARGSGKSSLLFSLQPNLDDIAYSLYIDLRTATRHPAGGNSIVFANLRSGLDNSYDGRKLADTIRAQVHRAHWSSEAPISQPGNGAASAYEECSHTLRRMLADAPRSRVILLIDHFELAMNPAIPLEERQRILGFLWEIQQLGPHLFVTVATCGTYGALRNENSSDFLDMAYSLSVPWLSNKEMSDLLRPKRELFFPQYDTNALDEMYELTAGHPQLVQATANLILNHFNMELNNDGNGKEGKKREPIITKSDVAIAMSIPDHYRLAHRCCQNIVDAIQPWIPDVQPILKELADPNGVKGQAQLAHHFYPNANAQEAETRISRRLDLLTAHGLVKFDVKTGRYHVQGKILRHSVLNQWPIPNHN